ncbi:MAG: hypothetical protein ACRD9Y_06215 [Blastocatellia bacterium]
MIKLDKESLPFETKEAIRSKAEEILPEVSKARPAFTERLISLDVFRGLTIAGMVLVNIVDR